ncbi:hypothetical protein ASE63_25430 [Bosea sp. Root381]|uniref:DUF6894 family protein n=1 Tax=Bosea sp. Root381 TaxID=1736524 RepID=UPI0006F77473|nr:hypothetical protein [Bosea sp. Root381]KRE04364.1 hypothetical protein ASE63_25430 [Bosea sp. Root381]
MPKFTITTETGQGPETYDEPVEFPHATAAEHDAQVALTEMCREGLPHDKSARYGVRIQDDAGNQVYKAALHFEAEREGETGQAPDVPNELPLGPRD